MIIRYPRRSSLPCLGGYRFMMICGTLWLVLMLPVYAQSELPRPSGQIILTVTGKITRTNVPGKAEFDRNLLTSLGLHQFTTSTPWTEGTPTFEGVLLRNLMVAVGATGHKVEASALNDYVSLIPMTDFDRYDVLLVLDMNGQALSRRDKGPIWIVYPLDQHPEIVDLGKISHLVWQLARLDVQ